MTDLDPVALALEADTAWEAVRQKERKIEEMKVNNRTSFLRAERLVPYYRAFCQISDLVAQFENCGEGDFYTLIEDKVRQGREEARREDERQEAVKRAGPIQAIDNRY